jgi:hypothetical protein
MVEEPSDRTYLSTEEARKIGAKARARNDRKDFIGWIFLGIGFLGLFATAVLTAEIARDHASPFIWEAFTHAIPLGLGSAMLVGGAYLASYFFIAYLAFTVFYNWSREQIGLPENILCSFWVLCTVVFFASPVIHSVVAFMNSVPGGWTGKVFIAAWAVSAYWLFQFLSLANFRRTRRRH